MDQYARAFMQYGKVDHADLPISTCRRVSAPLAAEHLECGARMLPPPLKRLLRHWRLCGRNGRAPRATAMEINQLRHLRCLTQFVAHVVPDGRVVDELGGFHILTANRLPSLEASSSMNPANFEPTLLPFHPEEANEIRQDWPRILNGEPVLRIVTLMADGRDRPVARLCLPIRIHAGAAVDSMVVAAEPADLHHADICPKTDVAGPISPGVGPVTEPRGADSGGADSRGADSRGADSGGSEFSDAESGSAECHPSSLPLETRLAFKARIQEATNELKRQALCRSDAERRGMLLEAARLQRLARKY